MKAWHVFLDGKEIDIVYFVESMTAEEVRRSLIDHDGFDPSIRLAANLSKPRHLRCSCCGGVARGRQWHNRDTGYGLCVGCVDYCAKREPGDAMERNYGVRGIHYDLAD